MRYSNAQRVLREGASRPIRLYCRDHRQFGDEAVIFEGQLSIDAARERVSRQFPLEYASRPARPARALGKPVKGERRHQEAGGFGDHMIVGGRSSTAERRKVVLVPPDLGQRHFVLFEELS